MSHVAAAEKLYTWNQMDAFFASERRAGGKAEARLIVLRVVSNNPGFLRTYATGSPDYATEQILRSLSWLRMIAKETKLKAQVIRHK